MFAPDYGNAQNLSVYGWSAVAFAIGAMLIYIGALIVFASVSIQDSDQCA